MSLDRSLKARDALVRHRNVLKRGERLAVLADEDRWEEGRDSVFGLPKVVHRKMAAGKKKKAKTEEETAVATSDEGETAAKPAGGDKG